MQDHKGPGIPGARATERSGRPLAAAHQAAAEAVKGEVGRRMRPRQDRSAGLSIIDTLYFITVRFGVGVLHSIEDPFAAENDALPGKCIRLLSGCWGQLKIPLQQRKTPSQPK